MSENPHHSSTFLCDWISLCSLVRLFSVNGGDELARKLPLHSHPAAEKEAARKSLPLWQSPHCEGPPDLKGDRRNVCCQRGLGGSQWGWPLTCSYLFSWRNTERAEEIFFFFGGVGGGVEIWCWTMFVIRTFYTSVLILSVSALLFSVCV